MRMLDICVFALRTASDEVTLEKSWKDKLAKVEYEVHKLREEVVRYLIEEEEHTIEHGRKMVDA
jgi:hypothetical protein